MILKVDLARNEIKNEWIILHNQAIKFHASIEIMVQGQLAADATATGQPCAVRFQLLLQSDRRAECYHEL